MSQLVLLALCDLAYLSSVLVPAIHGGGKTIVTYNGDYTVLKCDSYSYKPIEWLWYKVNGSEQVSAEE